MQVEKLKTVDADTLLSTPLRKTLFIVEGLIPQGLSVLSGASKIGKSWLMLWLGMQVARGNPVWEFETHKCDVLYLCLEDTHIRIQNRLYQLTDEAPAELRIATTSYQIGNGLEQQIEQYLTDFPNTKLVIIDTFQKVRDSRNTLGKSGMYAGDYDDITALKSISDRFGIAVIVVHHVRKMKDHQGVTSRQLGEKLLSVTQVSKDSNDSERQVHRYIRLTYLIPELLTMVDENKIAFSPAVEISYLEHSEQLVLLDAIELNDCTPSHAQSIRLKKLSQEGLLDQNAIYEIMSEEKPNQQEQIKLKREDFRNYFPPNYTDEQIKKDIVKGLELLKRQRDRNRDAR